MNEGHYGPLYDNYLFFLYEIIFLACFVVIKITSTLHKDKVGGLA